MNQSEVVKRIKGICDEFDSRAEEMGLPFARKELAKALAEKERELEHWKKVAERNDKLCIETQLELSELRENVRLDLKLADISVERELVGREIKEFQENRAALRAAVEK